MKTFTARHLASLTLSVICVFFLHPALTQPERFLPGTHYQILQDNPLLTEAKATELPIITEIFWYGCGGCYAFDPVLNEWVEKQDGSFRFDRSHIVWNRSTKAHARLFHSTRALGINETLHEDIFNEIHQHRNTLLSLSDQLEYLSNHGINTEQAEKAMNSFATDSKIRKAEALQRSIRVPSIPALVVNGRYLITGEKFSSTTEMLEVADFLLEKQE